IGGGAEAEGLERPFAVARDLGRRLVAMELDEVEREVGGGAVELPGRRVDEHADDGDAGTGLPGSGGEAPGMAELDEAARAGPQVEADEVGAGRRGVGGVALAGDAADLD